MEMFELGLKILLFYIPIWGIVNRICSCFERCKEARYGKKDEKTCENKGKPAGF